MKRIVVALLIECPPLLKVVKAGFKERDHLDEDTIAFVDYVLEEVRRVKLRKMMGEDTF